MEIWEEYFIRKGIPLVCPMEFVFNNFIGDIQIQTSHITPSMESWSFFLNTSIQRVDVRAEQGILFERFPILERSWRNFGITGTRVIDLNEVSEREIVNIINNIRNS